MKSMRPISVAIFFMTYFYRAGGGGRHGPLVPLNPLLLLYPNIELTLETTTIRDLKYTSVFAKLPKFLNSHRQNGASVNNEI